MYHKRTFWVVAHRHFPLKELCPQGISKSRVSLRNTRLRNSIQLHMCPAKAWFLNALAALITSCCLP